MGEIQVATQAVYAQATRLAGVSGQLDGARGWVDSTVDAAADTEAAGACAALAQNLSGALAAFGVSADATARAVAAAAECYAVADEVSVPGGTR